MALGGLSSRGIFLPVGRVHTVVVDEVYEPA